MNKIIFLLILNICVISCKKDNPCDRLVGGVYKFPGLENNHNMTSEEVADHWDLPNDISECISTEGLIETCLNYPNLWLIKEESSPQAGYNLVSSQFSGFDVLTSRPDRATCLIKKYQMVDPATRPPEETGPHSYSTLETYKYNIYYLELILGQYINLEPLSKEEKVSLIETAITIYDKKKSDIEFYGVNGLGYTTFLFGRIMYLNNYADLVDIYNDNELIKSHIDLCMPLNLDSLEVIYDFSEQYLYYVKNN